LNEADQRKRAPLERVAVRVAIEPARRAGGRAASICHHHMNRAKLIDSIGPFAGHPQSDRQPESARSAGNENGTSGEPQAHGINSTIQGPPRWCRSGVIADSRRVAASHRFDTAVSNNLTRVDGEYDAQRR